MGARQDVPRQKPAFKAGSLTFGQLFPGSSDLFVLAHGLDALGAHILADHAAIFVDNLHTLDIRLKTPLGFPV
jgi:hypothetical protein